MKQRKEWVPPLPCGDCNSRVWEWDSAVGAYVCWDCTRTINKKDNYKGGEAGAQMCNACNGTGEVQGEIQGGPPGPTVCHACNGKGTVAQ